MSKAQKRALTLAKQADDGIIVAGARRQAIWSTTLTALIKKGLVDPVGGGYAKINSKGLEALEVCSV